MTSAQDAGRRGVSQRVRGVLAERPWIGPLAALVVVFVLFGLATPETFLRTQNLLTMARQTVVVGVCALGMTMIIVTGGIDLSVGSVVALTTVIIAARLRDGAGPVSAAVTGVAVAGAVGAAVGVLVGRFRMMPFVVTLGTMSALRGVAKGIAKEQKIDCDPRGLDTLLVSAQGMGPGLFVALGLAVVVALTLTYTRFGRHVFAVGSNEAAARLAGIDPSHVKLLVYTLAGLAFGVGGVMEFSTLTVGDPTDSIGLELDVIAAVVIGGAPLAGGEGSVVGSILGALLMTVIKTGAVHLGLPTWVQEIVTGGIIVVAVALDRARYARR